MKTTNSEGNSIFLFNIKSKNKSNIYRYCYMYDWKK